MKSFVLLLTVLFAAQVQAANAPNFSVFNIGDDLYVTIMDDSCNNHRGVLAVEDFCQNDRATRNHAPFCRAELAVLSTRVGCRDSKLVPTVLALSLSESNVARESKVLELTYDGQKIAVQLDR